MPKKKASQATVEAYSAFRATIGTVGASERWIENFMHHPLWSGGHPTDTERLRLILVAELRALAEKAHDHALAVERYADALEADGKRHRKP